MECYICKKENLEMREINRLLIKNNEEIIVCDECIKKGNRIHQINEYGRLTIIA